MLEIRSLSVARDGKPILDDLSLSLRAGELTALLGPNGCGKTTLLQALAGILPARGRLRLDGVALPWGRAQRQLFSYMPQDGGAVSALSVIEVVLLGRLSSLGMRVPRPLLDEAAAMLDNFGLIPLAARSLGALSGGQRQMVFLAQALFAKPKVLLLDEPTSALDLRHQLIVLEHVRRLARERSIIAVAALHDLGQAARHAGRVVCLADGRLLAQGAPADVLSEDLLRRLYRVRVEIARGQNGTLHITPTMADGA